MTVAEAEGVPDLVPPVPPREFKSILLGWILTSALITRPVMRPWLAAHSAAPSPSGYVLETCIV